MLKRPLPVLFCLLLAVGTAFAADSGLKVEKAWARAALSTATPGAVYLTIVNAGTTADRLTRLSTPAAAEAQIHLMTMDRNVMQMRRVDALDVKPGERIELKPGGLHIMLVKLKQPLKQGGHFPLSLEFERAGRIDVEVLVLPIGAGGYPQGTD